MVSVDWAINSTYQRYLEDVAETRGFALSMPTARKLKKRLPRATHCTDGAQTSSTDPKVRVVPTPSNISDTKVRARRDMSENRGKNGRYN